jgi:hypothetical protein
MREHQITFPGTADEARRALREAAAAWGAQWTEGEAGKGELVLPVVAALRRGVVRAAVVIEPQGDASRIALHERESAVEVNRGAVAVLAIGGLGGVLLLLWPFFPKLLLAAPLAAVLAFLAWFLVVSRLRMSGPAEFLGDVLAGAAESR